MAINWVYDPTLILTVEETWRAFRNRYEAACDGYTTTIDGVPFELSSDQKTALRADVIAKWQMFQAAIDALKAHAVK